MQNGDEALPNIILAGRGILVKIFITLDPSFDQIVITFQHCQDKGMQNGDKA